MNTVAGTTVVEVVAGIEVAVVVVDATTVVEEVLAVVEVLVEVVAGGSLSFLSLPQAVASNASTTRATFRGRIVRG
jgi:hypothetical protein